MSHLSRNSLFICVGSSIVIAMWQPGYEKLCCLPCIQARDHNFAVCLCRVPKDKLEEGKVVECINCGCKGCASCD